MKYTHITLILTSTIALAACGGGSNGSDHTNPQQNNHHDAHNTDSQAHTNSDNSSSNNSSNNSNSSKHIYGDGLNDGRKDVYGGYISGKYRGGYIRVEDKDKPNPNTRREVLSAVTEDNIDTLIIDGKAFHLVNNGEEMIIGNELTHARYGYLRDKAEKVNYIFYHGAITTDMPVSGTANYQGQAIHFSPTHKGYKTNASFHVDFGKRTVSGVISGQDDPLVDIHAKIHGHTFTGEQDGIATDGMFFGSNGAELAGTYASSKQEGTGGIFGATKQ
ncbi:transferrin-binding protein-like solute binding protein [Cardiobacteriaceae bacterium TAE3-ERU3]|nr:transferrin-binding protein-like solute binding protein [Cardiobacteriaceae bacterium TAE3-ERU3]